MPRGKRRRPGDKRKPGGHMKLERKRQKKVQKAERLEETEQSEKCEQDEFDEELVALDQAERERPYHMTLGDIRLLIREEEFDVIDPDEEVGICYNCGDPVTILYAAQSDYEDDVFLEDAAEVLCSLCRAELY